MTSRPLPEIVGDFVKQYRRRHKITKDELALNGMRYGMTWGRTSIDNIEAGRSAITLPILFALCGALSGGGRGSVTIADMISDDDEVLMAGDFAVRGDRLKGFLAGEAIPVRTGDRMAWLDSLASHATTYTLAERRAASALGIDVADLVGLSIDLWGDRLDRVVTHAVGQDANAQKRGHETRRLLDQLRDRIGKS